MEAFIIIFSLVWGILSLILFFKIWGMTNDMHVIKDLLVDHFGNKVIEYDNTEFDGDSDVDNDVVADDGDDKVGEEKKEYIDVSSYFRSSNKKIDQFIRIVEDYVNFALQSGLDNDQIQSGVEYVVQENKSLLNGSGKDPSVIAKKVAGKIIGIYKDNHKV